MTTQDPTKRYKVKHFPVSAAPFQLQKDRTVLISDRFMILDTWQDQILPMLCFETYNEAEAAVMGMWALMHTLKNFSFLGETGSRSQFNGFELC